MRPQRSLTQNIGEPLGGVHHGSVNINNDGLVHENSIYIQSDKDIVPVDYIAAAKQERDRCKALPGKEDQIECIFELLHKITTAQDHTNLTIRSILDDDEDPRWIPIHIIDDANGVILGISRNRGKPELVVSEGYTGEKMSHIIDKWSMMNWRLQR